MSHICAYHHTKETFSKEELLLLKYNLDAQAQKKYQGVCQEGDNTIWWYYLPEYTYDLDTPDAGAGNNTKFWLIVKLDGWLWDSVNVCLWG